MFSAEEDFYSHLNKHSRKEVLEIRRIGEKKLQMIPEEEKDFDFELMKKWLKTRRQLD